MGNALEKAYNINKETEFGDPQYGRWTVHEAEHKTRKQWYSLFVFNKQKFERYESVGYRSVILDILRDDFRKLSKLRHPNILQIEEVLSEDKNSLAFVTQPLKGSLGSIISLSNRCFSECNIEEVSSSRKAYFAPLEVRCGLLELAEALDFLHNEADLVHRNINPESIFIDRNDSWVLGGMAFSKLIDTDGLSECELVFSRSHVGSVSVCPPLEYTAPEMVGTYPAKYGKPSDVFSFGLLMYKMLVGQQLIRCNDPAVYESACRNVIPLRQTKLDLVSHSLITRSCSLEISIFGLFLDFSLFFCFYQASCFFRTLVFLRLLEMISFDPFNRPQIRSVLNHQYFQDSGVRSFRYFLQLKNKNDTEKLQFLKGLVRLLDTDIEFQNSRVLRERIIPRLIDFIESKTLLSYVLLNLFIALKKGGADASLFQKIVWPKLKFLFTSVEIQVEALLIILQELEFLTELSDDEMIQQYLAPLVLKCLDVRDIHVRQVTIERLGSVIAKVEYSAIRDILLPKLFKILDENGLPRPMKAAVIREIGKLSCFFDRATIVSIILPNLKKASQAERHTTLCTAFVGALSTISEQIGYKMSCDIIVPILAPILVDEVLDGEQFVNVMSIIRSILDRVNESRLKEFQSLSENVEAAITFPARSEKSSIFQKNAAPPPPRVLPINRSASNSGENKDSQLQHGAVFNKDLIRPVDYEPNNLMVRSIVENDLGPTFMGLQPAHLNESANFTGTGLTLFDHPKNDPLSDALQFNLNTNTKTKSDRRIDSTEPFNLSPNERTKVIQQAFNFSPEKVESYIPNTNQVNKNMEPQHQSVLPLDPYRGLDEIFSNT